MYLLAENMIHSVLFLSYFLHKNKLNKNQGKNTQIRELKRGLRLFDACGARSNFEKQLKE